MGTHEKTHLNTFSVQILKIDSKGICVAQIRRCQSDVWRKEGAWSEHLGVARQKAW